MAKASGGRPTGGRRAGARVAKSSPPSRRKARKPRPAPHAASSPNGRLPVAGIGASAGGLEALTEFFDAMPKGPVGMAFVLIQHLDPRHTSLTPELLQRHTTLKVVEVEGDAAVRAGHVYVIPPNHYLAIDGGVLRLSVFPEPRTLRMPINFFFRSLARDLREGGVAVVLSGTGSDGTEGLKEVKEMGGLVLAQAPNTAQHDGMPRSAIASGAVDQILPPAEMPAVILRYAKSPFLALADPQRPPTYPARDRLLDVVSVLNTRVKFDFSAYKAGTLCRRIQRRMGLRRVEDIGRYGEMLREDAAEVSALFKDLLISVTGFFREPAAAWGTLEKPVISDIVERKENGEAIRVWVPACATGEEPYSIAMLLVEGIQAARKDCRIQIFASDVDTEAIEFARTGVYPENIVADVSAERLRRFFTRSNHSYGVKKDLRESVVFAEQNLVIDPPFSKLDLISCRNLLIYLVPAVQKRVLSLLHFALTDEGYLFLGSAESVGGAEDLFKAVSQKSKIYQRIGPSRLDLVHVPVVPPPAAGARPKGVVSAALRPPIGIAALAQQILSERYKPACVLINRKHEILYFSGPTSDYLGQPIGLPTENLLAKAHEGLRTKLRAAVLKAIREDRVVRVEAPALRGDPGRREVMITVDPLKAPKQAAGLLLIAFEEHAKGALAESDTSLYPEKLSAADDDLVGQLEGELKSTREDLQATIEELEAANEELRAANEEVMSANEELQSTNEELETSKEVLQSLNEEIASVNCQLETKIAEVQSANDDLNNLIRSSETANLFLDLRLCLRRFTPAMTGLLRLIPADVGRPITDLADPFVKGEFVKEAQAVLERLVPVESEVRTDDGRWLLRRILPYRTRDDRIEGVVVNFVDITALKEAELRLEQLNRELEVRVEERTRQLVDSGARLRAIVDTATEGIATIDEDGDVLSFNPAAEAMFGYTAKEVLGKDVKILLPPLTKEMVGRLQEMTAHRKDGTAFPIELSVGWFQDGAGGCFTAVVRDITKRKGASAEARRRREELARVLRMSEIGEVAAGIVHEFGQPLAAIANRLEACALAVDSSGKAPEVASLLREAEADTVRAGGIFHRLRDFLGKRESCPETVDFRNLPENVIQFFHGPIEAKGIDLQVDLGEVAVMVTVDEVQAKQVILNLVQNAIDAVADDKVRRKEIRIEIRRTGQMAELVVHDSGPGLSRIRGRTDPFDAFFTTKPGGLGMGLSISRAIVEAHGGRIVLERRPDNRRGATARVTLPLAKQ